MQFSINYMTVIVAAIINMALGFIWYGPLFGKMWMKLTGRTKESMDKEKKDMSKVMGTMFVGALVMAYVLAHFIIAGGASDAITGGMIGFWAWLGFVATTMLADVLYEKKNKNLAAINLGYFLAVLVINGALLAVWR